MDPRLIRENRYQDLSEVGKSLINNLYGSKQEYLESFEHPMERYIIAYDQNLDDESALRAIADRLDLILFPENIYEQLYEFFEKFSNK